MNDPEHGQPDFRAMEVRTGAWLDQAHAQLRDATRLAAIMAPYAVSGQEMAFTAFLDRLPPDLRAEVEAIMKRLS